MRRLIPAATGLTALIALVAAVPASASEAESGPVTCKRVFHVALHPPLTLTDGDHTFDENGVFATCSNGLDGTLIFSGGTFHGSCKGGHAESHGGVIRWNDGTVSVEEAKADVVVPPFVTLVGEITKGRFAGRSVHSEAYLVPKDPQNCIGTGITDVDVYGGWTFQ